MDNFRKPIGAIKEGEKVVFEFPFERYDTVKLHLIEDSTNKEAVSNMELGNNYFKLETILNVGLYWYFFEILEHDGVTFTDTFQLNVYENDFRTPDWLKGGIIYHIFIDRFCRVGRIKYKENSILRYDWDNGIPLLSSDGGKTYCNDFFGGNLLGVISKLDYLKSLGVKCIYLSPIFEANSNHRYDTNDHMKVDKMVGNDFTLWLLCKVAKAKDIYIILDIAFNHVGSDSKYFNDSKYDEWFTKHEDGSYDCWWGFPTLPSIRKDTPQSYKDHVEKVLIKWMKLGVKGFRLDVADELSNDLLKHIRNVVKGYDKEAVIFGEVWEDASNKEAYGRRKNYFNGDKLDSVMNYPFRKAILEFVENKNSKLLIDTINSLKINYPKEVQHVLMNMLSSHDEFRVKTYLNGDIRKIRIAILLQMILIGCPCIYYGDEIGMEGEKDPYNRKPMSWNNVDQEINSIYKEFIKLRNKYKSLRFGEIFIFEYESGILEIIRTFDSEIVSIKINPDNMTYVITNN